MGALQFSLDNLNHDEIFFAIRHLNDYLPPYCGNISKASFQAMIILQLRVDVACCSEPILSHTVSGT
jgi:hypothetical protein